MFLVWLSLYKTISIHALREEGDPGAIVTTFEVSEISIHALREEGDSHSSSVHPQLENFYPRPPRGGRLQVQALPIRQAAISIHALREEGDDAIIILIPFKMNFYPRPPRGGRLYPWAIINKYLRFLSTPSARRAT